MEGIIFNIKKYSIHDGPGIRTTVFLKGCPLRCKWCHNPEGISSKYGFFYNSQRCIDCNTCVSSCEHYAVKKKGDDLNIDLSLCETCDLCTVSCPTDSLKIIGKKYNTVNLLREIEKDELFFDESGGGVTFSGGEPLYQFEFLKEMLRICKNSELHIAVDTSGFVSTDKLMEIMNSVDLFLFDFKIYDNKKHIEFTGVSNELIKENLKLLASSGKKIWIRIPIIKNINDDDFNVLSTIDFLKGIDFKGSVFLLPYHNSAVIKKERLICSNDIGISDLLAEYENNDQTRIEEIKIMFKQHGFDIHIGG